jgi:pimeloyl-ACP methyl ester carboxylesterase
MATEPRQQLSDTNTRSRHRALLLSGLPVTERRLQVAGVSTAVLEGGAGAPILLLHGPGDFAGMWMRVIPDLVTTHRVIAPDLPGHGTSELVDGRLDADGLRAWLSGLIERTCPSPPALVGHVLGGAIGARFAVNHSDRLSRLVAGRFFREFGIPPIPPDDLARIAVPTALIWGRHDRGNRLRIAQDASARYGWPLHVIENCADDPPRDQPLAFMEALRVTLGTERGQSVTA